MRSNCKDSRKQFGFSIGHDVDSVVSYMQLHIKQSIVEKYLCDEKIRAKCDLLNTFKYLGNFFAVFSGISLLFCDTKQSK
jgi:hypothetical protein